MCSISKGEFTFQVNLGLEINPPEWKMAHGHSEGSNSLTWALLSPGVEEHEQVRDDLRERGRVESWMIFRGAESEYF